MAKKQMSWKTKGMNRDLSVSAFNPEFSFENMNLRLSTNNGNTLLSWVNEKGTQQIQFSEIKNIAGVDITSQGIWGDPIGTAVLNHKLVLFTAHSSGVNSIYVFEYTNNAKTTMKGKLLYRGSLRMTPEYPLETLVSYEIDNEVEKVYWTDGKNQPRMINIAASVSKMAKWNESSFDFVPAYQMKDSVTIQNHIGGGGLFAPGVIQYAFSYINKYGQQSNLVYVSPLLYLAHSTRGASPEEKVANTFEIAIHDVDKSFDYIRLYSIQRTSLNATPIVKHLDDIPVSGTTPEDIFQRTLVYSNSSSLVLPKNDNGRILTAQVSRGSYTVAVTPVSLTGFDINSEEEISGSAVFANANDIWFVGYDFPSSDTHWDDIISLQELINRLYAPEDFSDGEPDQYFNNDYHSGFGVTQGLDMALNNLAHDHREQFSNYGLRVGNNIYWGDSQYGGFYQQQFIYNYADQKWYITTDSVRETVTKDEEEGSMYILYTDNGTTGSTIDPTELLFIGGKEISALTMTEKDNTLFLGNIEQKNTLVTAIQDYFDSIRGESGAMTVSFKNDGDSKQLTMNHTDGVYGYTNLLKWNQRQMSTFKGGETYRFGFQLQKNTGEWTESIFIDDFENTKYPNSKLYTDTVNLVYAEATLDLQALSTAIGGFDYSTFKKARPVIVYPSIGDRTVICQGVLNPTVFNVQDRPDNSPFAQASWFFRPYMSGSVTSGGGGSDIIIDDYVTPVITIPLPNPMDLSVDSFFIENGLVQNVSVLIADIDNVDYTSMDWRYQSPLYTGTVIHWYLDQYVGDPDPRTDTYDSGYKEIPILGVIKLGAGDTRPDWYDASSGTQHYKTSTRYAILSLEGFPAECSIHNQYDDGARSNYEIEYLNVHYKATANKVFKCYSRLQGQGNYLYYTRIDNDAPEHYHFKFYAQDSNTGYEAYVDVDFKSAANESGYTPIVGDEQGDALRYKHYDYIFAQSEVTANSGYTLDYFEQARQVEIQGSRNIYNRRHEEGGALGSTISAVFNDNVNAANCNGQFFIDQSIITLNSPDLEFDTDVQNYNAEGLALRIIGAIPITSNISAHHITSSALEVQNLHTDAGGGTGSGELNLNVVHYNISNNGGKRLISDLFWNDVPTVINSDYEDGFYTSNPHNFYVHPWQKNGSLANDKRSNDKAGSVLKTKKESQLLYSLNTEFFGIPADGDTVKDFKNISYQTLLTENAEIINARLPKQKKTSTEINYYPNIDRVLVNNQGYKALGDTTGYPFNNGPTLYNPVSMKYKSITHAAIALNADNMSTSSAEIPLLPYVIDGVDYGKYENPVGSEFPKTFWEASQMRFAQGGIDTTGLFINGNVHRKHSLLWLGEVYKKSVSNRFGGKSKEAVRNNKWLIAGDSVKLTDNSGNGLSSVQLKWTTGDTYYQRYDSLKTYAYTPEDQNQIVEILSFMCETHVNIDGRFDKNRGQVDNTNMSPQNFNVLNPVYSQQDNFFTSRKLDMEDINKLSYPNQITFTKTKESGADVDLWTNITLASMLEMDGDKGNISKLARLNDQIICFQDSGISQVLYNENVQVSTEQGVPIEIANSGKVQGKRYLSNTVGCSNKWSVVNTPAGIYFMDSNEKSIYRLGEGLHNISQQSGMNSWCKQRIPATGIKWSPTSFDNFVSYYDKLNQDVLFINKQTALAYSEKFGVFTSFYDYGNSPFFCNLDDTGIWLKGTKIWKHQAGDYCRFFGDNKPYWMTLVGNPEPQMDKIFTNLEFRACVEGEGSTGNATVLNTFDSTFDSSFHKPGEVPVDRGYIPFIPFDSLETWNEYQHGIANLDVRNGHSVFKHHSSSSKDASLNRKFRIWRCDIPRDNAELNTDAAVGVTRFSKHSNDRMRNPWLYLKLLKKVTSEDAMNKTEIHDIVMTYFS